MKQDKTGIDIRNAKDDFELLDLIRLRYQMYANDIDSLNGILVGYGLAKEDYKQHIGDFSKYLTDMKGMNPYAVSWTTVIVNEAEKTEYEIPVFYQYLDEFRNIRHEILGEVELSWEQRHFDFRRKFEQVNIDFPDLPLKAPNKLQAVKIPGVKTHAFHYDEKGHKYYEQCFKDFTHLKKWARESFNINEHMWK